MRPPHFAGLLAAAVAGGLIGGVIGAAEARADPQSLSPFVPVQVEDALPVRLGDIELQGDGRFTQDSHNQRGSGLWNFEPVLKLGAAPGLQLDLSAPYAVGDQSGANLGGGTIDALYQFHDNSTYIPALAVHAYYATPYGGGHHSAEYTLRGIATKFLGSTDTAPRIDLQFSWYHLTQPSSTQRSDQLEMGAAYSTLLTRDTALVVDYVHGAKPDKRADENIVDVGLRREVSDTLAVSFGVGAGIAEQSPEFRVLFAVQKDIRLF